MDRVLVFNAVQVATTLYAVAKGGGPERIVGIALLAAASGTLLGLSSFDVRFAGVEIDVLMVDMLLLVVLVSVALHADRHWAAWVAALQMLGIGAHLAEAVSPDTTRLAYAILSAAWSYPMLLLLAVGTLRHTRRLKTNGFDLDWSRFDLTLARR